MAAGTGFGLNQQPGAPNNNIQLMQIQARVRIGAGWFIWIAGLSIVNALILESGGRFHFIFGLGMTDVVTAMVAKLPSGAHAAAWVVNIIIAAVFALFGKFGREMKKWAFIAGMAFYVLDSALMLLFQDWLGLAFHAYAMWRMYSGFAALNEYNDTQQIAKAMGA
jgi:hypothetical protein